MQVTIRLLVTAEHLDHGNSGTQKNGFVFFDRISIDLISVYPVGELQLNPLEKSICSLKTRSQSVERFY